MTKIASNSWIYYQFNISGLQYNDYRCPTKSEIDDYGLVVSGNYDDNQLVKESDISSTSVNGSLFVGSNKYIPSSSRYKVKCIINDVDDSTSAWDPFDGSSQSYTSYDVFRVTYYGVVISNSLLAEFCRTKHITNTSTIYGWIRWYDGDFAVSLLLACGSISANSLFTANPDDVTYLVSAGSLTPIDPK